MLEINQLVAVVFSGLPGLVIDDVADEGERIRVRARSRKVSVPCPGCAVETSRVHAWCDRVVDDVALDGRPVVVNVRLRRLACRDWRCPRRTFREQVAGVLERYQRGTVRLTAQVTAVVRELAGRASARVLPALDVPISRHAALRAVRPLLGPAFTRVLAVGIDKRGTVLGCPPHLFGLVDPRVPFDGVQGEVHPAGCIPGGRRPH